MNHHGGVTNTLMRLQYRCLIREKLCGGVLGRPIVLSPVVSGLRVQENACPKKSLLCREKWTTGMYASNVDSHHPYGVYPVKIQTEELRIFSGSYRKPENLERASGDWFSEAQKSSLQQVVGTHTTNWHGQNRRQPLVTVQNIYFGAHFLRPKIFVFSSNRSPEKCG